MKLLRLNYSIQRLSWWQPRSQDLFSSHSLEFLRFVVRKKRDPGNQVVSATRQSGRGCTILAGRWLNPTDETPRKQQQQQQQSTF